MINEGWNKVLLLNSEFKVIYELGLDDERYKEICDCGIISLNNKHYIYIYSPFTMEENCFVYYVESKEFMVVKSEVQKENFDDHSTI